MNPTLAHVFLLFRKVCREAFSARALRGDRSGLTALMTALEWGGPCKPYLRAGQAARCYC